MQSFEQLVFGSDIREIDERDPKVFHSGAHSFGDMECESGLSDASQAHDGQNTLLRKKRLDGTRFALAADEWTSREHSSCQ